MIISDKGVLEVAEHEGMVLGPYRDSVGVWTYGVGHTAAAGGLDPAKMDRSDTRGWNDERVRQELLGGLHVFDDDLDKYEARVRGAVKVPLAQHQFDALVSFDFNTGGIYRAKLTQALNRGDMDAAAEGFMGWLRPKEIIKRRTAEMMLFRTGDYTANGSLITVWDALPDGRIRRRGHMDSRELAALMKSAGAKHKPSVVPASRVWSFLKRLFGSLKHKGS